jgi:hypothetical protein
MAPRERKGIKWIIAGLGLAVAVICGGEFMSLR